MAIVAKSGVCAQNASILKGLGRLYSWSSSVSCDKCICLTENLVVHKIHFCNSHINERMRLWSLTISICGVQAYRDWCKNSHTNQNVHLLTGIADYCSAEKSKNVLLHIIGIFNSIFKSRNS